MNRFLIILLIAVAIIISCKNDQSVSNDKVISQDIPSDFLNFYQKFHADSNYQMEHIIFPLAGKSDSTKWEEATWIQHKPFDNSTNEFERQFSNFQGIVIEKIVSKDNSYFIERRFSKSGETYNLIYYKVFNAFENSDFEQIEE